jgi:hypothetical protein
MSSTGVMAAELQESMNWVETLKKLAPPRSYFPIFEFERYD